MIDADNQHSHLQAERYFVENMIRLRESLGWSQTELARRMVNSGWPNYNQMTVSRTEKLERPLRLSEAESIATLLDTSLESMMQEPALGALESELMEGFDRLYESFGTASTALSRLVDARSELALIMRGMESSVRDNPSLRERAFLAAKTLEELTVEKVIAIARREPEPPRRFIDEDPAAAWERFQSAEYDDPKAS